MDPFGGPSSKTYTYYWGKRSEGRGSEDLKAKVHPQTCRYGDQAPTEERKGRGERPDGRRKAISTCPGILDSVQMPVRHGSAQSI